MRHKYVSFLKKISQNPNNSMCRTCKVYSVVEKLK